ncbi:MAG TPA: hypothetical protein VHQ90_21935 [Thermoanaerobaculia bacterium]|nr:hypothetical protein [Thermoanaerobaculia bacterium]
MTPELARADRAAAVRDAACSWHRAGVLDQAALAAVELRFPDDRVRVAPAFRGLLFFFTAFAIAGGWGFVVLLVDFKHDGVLAGLGFLAGAALAGLTEIQLDNMRRRQGGTEEATSLAAVGLLLGAVGWALVSEHALHLREGWPVFYAFAAALLAAAAWRWGYPLYALAAAAAVLTALAWLPAGRALWIVLPLAAAPALLRLSRSPHLPPAHRSSATAALVMALAGLYLAVHVGSWAGQVVERLAGRHPAPPPHSGLAWWSASAATTLVPVFLLAWGLRRRNLALLVTGCAAAVASAATLPHYIHLGPTWLLLAAGGALLIALVLALWRYLESAPGGERNGFTAAPLFADLHGQDVLAAGATALLLPAEPRDLSEDQQYAGGGGRSGGAGATTDF